ncbi:hypothetical protein [Rhodovulum visakhapatnamense]|uniref:Methyl-accepting chemotaxis protein n=1 Tax=Rhodovulum visakhapatnamense TaxID=364297 RepID=A0A4R8FH69_9RHOB|nr:hypothetical protein [Rhodovulum visakhapatnamense]TDX25384.1 hypothetical protein EV657_12019 [Rhodovulum visakhapatnamense]
MSAAAAWLRVVPADPPGSAVLDEIVSGRFAAHIAGPRQAIEQAFLAMGSGLMAGAHLLTDISAAHRDMALEFEGPAFLQGVEQISRLRDEVGRVLEGITTGDAEIARLAETTKRVRTPLEQMDSAIRLLGLVAVNARIVAAGIESDQNDLTAFTSEMAGIAAEAKAAVRSISEVHERVCRTVAETRRTQTEFSRGHFRTMAAIRDRLDEDLRSIEAQRAQAAEHADRSATLAAGIGAQVGEAVAAVQAGDMTRQRLEHVETILDRLADAADAADAERLAGLLGPLAAAELGATHADFVAEVGHFVNALEAMRVDADAVLRAGTERAGRTLAASGEALAALVRDLRSIRPLLDDEARNRETARQLGEGAADAMHLMMSRIDVLERTEHDVRLLGLNMAIRCSGLGDRASGLRVIAKELSGVAADTSAAAAQIRDILDGAQKTVADTRRRTAEGGGVEGDPAAAASDLETVLDRLRAHGVTLAEACPRTIAILDETAERAHRVSASGDGWPALVARLETLGGTPDPDEVAAFGDLLAGIRRVYTMQQERRIHDAVLGLPTPGGEDEPPAADGGDADDIDGFLF